MNLSALANEVLLAKVKSLIEESRRMDVASLHHLAETARRRVYAERGDSSMWDFLKRAHNLGEASIQRRLDTIQLMKAFPQTVAARHRQAARRGQLTPLDCDRQRDARNPAKTKGDIFALASVK